MGHIFNNIVELNINIIINPVNNNIIGPIKKIL